MLTCYGKLCEMCFDDNSIFYNYLLMFFIYFFLFKKYIQVHFISNNLQPGKQKTHTAEQAITGKTVLKYFIALLWFCQYNFITVLHS